MSSLLSAAYRAQGDLGYVDAKRDVGRPLAVAPVEVVAVLIVEADVADVDVKLQPASDDPEELRTEDVGFLGLHCRGLGS